MKVKDLNKSSEKTKALIKRTAIEMLHDMKDSNMFTVSELTRRANINRTTFYTHYSGIGDVISAVQADVVKSLIQPYRLMAREDIVVFLCDAMNGIRENEEEYRLMLASDEPIIFLTKVRGMFLGKIFECEELKTLENREQLLLNIHIFLGGMWQLYMDYFHGVSEYDLWELEKGLLHTLQLLLFEEPSRNRI